MRVLITAAGLAALAEVCVAASSASYVLHEERTTEPRTWRRTGRVDRDAIVPVRIALMQSNVDAAEDLLRDVSHPHSPNYGKHWTVEEVNDMFAPSDDAVAQVRAWLEDSGITEVLHTENKQWLAFDIPASQAEELLQTDFYEFERASKPGSEKVKIGSDGYHLPSHLVHHVDYVTPGVALSSNFIKTTVKRDLSKRQWGGGWGGKPNRPTGPVQWFPPEFPEPFNPPPYAQWLPPDLQDCARNMTPTCIRAMYQIPVATRNDGPGIIGVYEDDDIYAQSDLDASFTKYAPNVPNGTHPILDSVDGGEAPVAADNPLNGGESEIDLELIFSLTYPQEVILYQVDDSIEDNTDSNFNVFLDAIDGSYCTFSAFGVTGDTPGIDSVYPDPAPGGYKGPLMCGTYKPTEVISISYGPSEYDAPLNYTKRQCVEYLKLGLRGTTIVYASGDYGVGAPPGDDSDSGCLGVNQTVYNPSYPTCPWVLDVGATQLFPGQTVLDRESAMQPPDVAPNFGSAGGFANYFGVPFYQKEAVEEYFQNHDPNLPYYIAEYNSTDVTNIGENGGVYNRKGRGFPDMAANGANLRTFVNGSDGYWYGTSLAAPIVSSVFTLINQERKAIGKKPVGFVNPALYQNPWVLNDVVNGSNPNCGGPGFSAVEGWDPVTGLGTPNYPRMLELFLSLP